jgi:hypothetical protein
LDITASREIAISDRCRREWRGDFFNYQLAEIQARLSRFPKIEREFSHTVTIFFAPAPPQETLRFDKAVRLRTYRNLPRVSADIVRSILSTDLPGKLQVKHRDGRIEDRGYCDLLPGASNSGLPTCTLDGIIHQPISVRITPRLHYALEANRRRPTAKFFSESHRVTLDPERHLFRVGGDGNIKHLGEMGPRLEIKTPEGDGVVTALQSINFDGAIRCLPYRGLELLFQDFLRDRISQQSRVQNREIELKFDLHRKLEAGAILQMTRRLSGAALLLPYPHMVVRMRRYHVCRAVTEDSDEYTIVETPAGRLSEKRKRYADRQGCITVRRTEASFTTDRDGARCAVDELIAEKALISINSFTKVQTKIPFHLKNDHAYLISLDDCDDISGRNLKQMEIEYIGNTTGNATGSEEIVGELQGLGGWLRDSPIGEALTPSAWSKHAYFSQRA